MNRTLFTIAAAAAFSAPFVPPAQAQRDLGKYNRMFEMMVLSGDVDADGRGDIIMFDAGTGLFATGYGASGGGFSWESPRELPSGGWNSAMKLRRDVEKAIVADLDHDGASDFVIPDYHRNRVLVLKGSSTRSRALTSMEEYFPGPGPAGVAAAQLDKASAEMELVLPVIAQTQPRTVSVLPRVGWEVLVDYGPIDPVLAAGLTGFAVLNPAAPGSQTGRPVSHVGGTFTLTFNGQTTNPLNHLEVTLLGGNKPPVGTNFVEPYRHLFAANMRGSNEPGQFVLWAPGLDSLAIATVTENPGAVAIESLKVQVEKIDYVSSIGGPGGLDRVAVVNQGGTRVTVFGWDPARRRIEALQTLNAPQGQTFAGPLGKLAGGAGGLFALMSDGGYLKYQFDASGNLQLTHQGVLPQFPAFGGNTTVMLYTADPLSGEAFEFESFVAGQWATGATFAGGKINVTREIFQDTTGGLGQPAVIHLTPSANPGAGAQAQANQFGDPSSSLFYAGDASADGNAGVEISPPPGDYNLPVHVHFTLAEKTTTILYRVNGQAWQQAAAGGFMVASDAVIEYYGQSAAGALSSIKSAAYEIEPLLAGGTNPGLLPTDSDKDGMDDAFEGYFLNGLGQAFWDDNDRDGFSDGEEYLAQANPADASDVPPGTPSTPRTLWKKAQFDDSWDDPFIAADEADPDFDGMSNGLEYMTGGDPDNPNDAPQPRAASQPDGRLGLTFNRLPVRTDIVIDVESSESLTGPWRVIARSTGGGTVASMAAGVAVVESGTGPTRQVSVTDGSAPANPASTRKFLRVAVRTN